MAHLKRAGLQQLREFRGTLHHRIDIGRLVEGGSRFLIPPFKCSDGWDAIGRGASVDDLANHIDGEDAETVRRSEPALDKRQGRVVLLVVKEVQCLSGARLSRFRTSNQSYEVSTISVKAKQHLNSIAILMYFYNEKSSSYCVTTNIFELFIGECREG
ncbi:hypothetical protein D3C85_1032880 [compost metagenome]